MGNFETPGLTPRASVHWPSILQLILSTLAAVLFLGAGVIIIIVNLAQTLTPGAARSSLTQSFLVAGNLVFAGALVIPSAWYSWQSIAHPETDGAQRPTRRGYSLILTILVLVLVPGALLLGNLVSQNEQIAWFLLPPLNIIATGLPALWLVDLGTRGLPLGTHRRRWGVFAGGLVLGPLISIILELLVLAGVGILALLWVMLNPGLSSQMNDLVVRLENSGSNPDVIMHILLPFILNPGILFIGFALISVIVPMIEEAFKPIGVWFLAGQKLTPTQGFAYGVLSGAGFGLLENLETTSSGGEAWALLASSRISTLLLHCFTAGLVGWALVSAWSQRRYLRLGASYILAVIVHGLWNGLAVLSVFSSLQSLSTVSFPANIQQIGTLSYAGIVILGVTVLVLYVGFNALLRRNQAGSGIPLTLEIEAPQHQNELSSSTPQQTIEEAQNQESDTKDHPGEGNPPNSSEINL